MRSPLIDEVLGDLVASLVAVELVLLGVDPLGLLEHLASDLLELLPGEVS
jgi:hypothetical protein